MTNTNTPPAGNISAAPRYKARWLTVCGFLMAMNTVLSSFNIPVPGGHFYLNDVIIVAAALSLDPLGAFLVGGVGAFLGDFLFLPSPHVCFACHPRTGSRRHFPLCPALRKEESSPYFLRRLLRRAHRGYRLFSRQGLCIQYPGIFSHQTPL